jgi:hypothetical protein
LRERHKGRRCYQTAMPADGLGAAHFLRAATSARPVLKGSSPHTTRCHASEKGGSRVAIPSGLGRDSPIQGRLLIAISEGYSAAIMRCFVPPRTRLCNGQSGQFKSGSTNGSKPTAESGRHWFRSATLGVRLNRSCCTPSMKNRCRAVNRRPGRELSES